MLGLLFVSASEGLGQSGRKAAQKVADLAGDFSVITSIRELSDGRVLVTDRRSRELGLISANSTEHRIVGRNGDGPGEYGNPHDLRVAGLDSTVLASSGGKLQLLFRDRCVSPTSALRRHAAAVISNIEGVDIRGNALRVVGIDKLKADEKPRFTQSITFSAVLAVIRISPNGEIDTLRKIRGGYEVTPNQRSRKSELGGLEFFHPGSGFPSAEQAVIFPDGRIAIALHNPYRVDWIFPNNERSRGQPITEAPIAVTEEMKRRIARDHRMPNAVPEDFAFWPKIVPPFGFSALHAGIDGRLYVQRMSVGFDMPSAFDVIDPSGNRQTYTLPPRSRLVGVGARGVYVSIRDDDDLETLALFKVP